MKALELLLVQKSTATDTAAILVEPILGEGGYVVPPSDFFPQLRKFCDKNGILLIVDEVQTGFGRTGEYFAINHYNVIPDIIVFAKGIASGFPLSGMVSRRDLTSKQPPGSMGGTFAGNAVSCAAALATLRIFKEENLLQIVNQRGIQLRKALLDLQNKMNVISDVRGLGLMLGVEFKKDKVPKGFASDVCKRASELGLLLLSTSCFETVRFIPPLNVDASEISTAVSIFEKSVEDLLKSHKI